MSKVIYKFMEDELVRLLFSEVTDLTYLYDIEGKILFVNKIFEKFTGCRPEEYYGKPFVSLFGEGDMKKAMDAYTRTLKGECPQCELYLKNTGVLCEYKNFPLRDEKGIVIGVMGIARDITARKRVEEGLMVLNASLEKRVVDHTVMLAEVNEELVEEIDTRQRLEAEFKRSVEKLQKSLKGVVQTLALTVESKDAYASGHQRRVARIACCIAEEMGILKDRMEGLRLAATLHDIGKVSIPAEILNSTGQLTQTEFEIIKAHPGVGHDILKEMEFPHPVAQIVLQHHERVNGSGYPFGLSAKDILLEAKILGIADVVEAMSSQRSYRPSLGLEKALDEISQKRGILYDFNVVHACMVAFNEKGFSFEQERNSNIRLFEDDVVCSGIVTI